MGDGGGFGRARRPLFRLRVILRLLLAAGVLILTACACAPRPPRTPKTSRSSTRQEIRILLDAGFGALGVVDTAGAGPTWIDVREFYAQRGDSPAWSGRKPHRQAAELVSALERVVEAGLDPADYDTGQIARLLAQAQGGGPLARWNRERVLAKLDVHATYAFLRLASHLRDGRVPRAALDPDWAHAARAGDWTAYLKRSLTRDPARSFAELEPRHEGYQRLRAGLARYRAIAAAGGWGELPQGPPLAVGERGERVASLVRRLGMSGDLPTPVRDTVFDRRIEQAIGDFQTCNGIPRSGILGEATRAALNVPVETRMRAMELNLERWRWLPVGLGERHVEINIPAYRLDLVRGGRVTRAMRVVVGRRQSPTPVFSDALAYLDVNPTWTLPPSVVVKEIVPALRRHPDYLASNHMHVFSIAQAVPDTVDPRQVPWKRAASDSFLYLVIQDAGPDNPLGRVKIMCPNEYDVYLHDSPQRSRFAVAARDYSHGCVRVEEAAELADSLLGRAPGDTLVVDSLIARGRWRRVRLPEPVPVHFLYWTAWADTAGRLHFRDDLYGLDARLDQALRVHATAALALNPGVALSPFWLAAEERAREAALRVAEDRGAAKTAARKRVAARAP